MYDEDGFTRHLVVEEEMLQDEFTQETLDQASRLKPKGISSQTGNTLETRLKNSVGCSIGLVFNY